MSSVPSEAVSTGTRELDTRPLAGLHGAGNLCAGALIQLVGGPTDRDRQAPLIISLHLFVKLNRSSGRPQLGDIGLRTELNEGHSGIPIVFFIHLKR